MKSKKTVVRTTTVKKETTPAVASQPLFEKANYMWMIGGLIIMVIGYLLMSGGRSDDPNTFNPDEVYSTTRITIAPILILAGLVVLIFAIFRQPKNREVR
jgi:hypothetical protein